MEIQGQSEGREDVKHNCRQMNGNTRSEWRSWRC